MEIIISNLGGNPESGKRPREYSRLDLAVKDFADCCCNGYAFRAGLFPQGASFAKKNCDFVNMIAFDFLEVDTLPTDMCSFAASLGLRPTMYCYLQRQDPSLTAVPNDCEYISSGNMCFGDMEYAAKQSYRLIWVLERPIPAKEARAFTNVLVSHFPQCDKSSLDVSRLLFGGFTTAVVLDDTPVPLSSLGWIEVASKIERGVSAYCIREAVSGCAHYYLDQERPRNVLNVSMRKLEVLNGHCELWDRWVRQEHMGYNERLMLWSNLRYLRDGNRNLLVNDMLRFFDPSKWTEEDNISPDKIRKHFQDTNLRPMPIVDVDGEMMTVPQVLESGASLPLVLDKSDYVSIDELDSWMDGNFESALEDNRFVYFQSQTGSGKTERVIRYYSKLNGEGRLGKQVYAVPNHKLASEVESRMVTFDESLPVYRVERVAFYSDEDLQRLKVGIPAKARNSRRSEIIKKLFDSSCGVFILTHSMLLQLEGLLGSVDRVIIDENIEEALVYNISMTKSEAASLVPFCGFDHIDAGNVKEAITDIKSNHLEDYLDNGVLIDGLFRMIMANIVKDTQDGGIRAVVKSPFISDIVYNDTPVALLTATPMSERIKAYYGVDFTVIEAPRAKNTGKVTQYCGISGARGNNNSKLPSYVSFVDEVLPKGVKDTAVLISFKDSREIWEAAGFTVADVDGNEVHLKNNAGLDCFKGGDLIVVGKFDLPEEYYRNLWEDTGNKGKLSRQNRVIDYNGVRQKVYVWEQPSLRLQQLQYMEYVTAQAVGRSRCLRYPNNVYLFSDFIIRDADVVYR